MFVTIESAWFFWIEKHLSPSSRAPGQHFRRKKLASTKPDFSAAYSASPVAFAVVALLANGKDLSTREIIKSEAGLEKF